MKMTTIEKLRNPQWTRLAGNVDQAVLDPKLNATTMSEAAEELEAAYDRIAKLEEMNPFEVKPTNVDQLIHRLHNPTWYNGKFQVEGKDGAIVTVDMPPVLSTAHTLTDMRAAACDLEKLADLLANARLGMSEREELLYQAASDILDMLDKPVWGRGDIKQVKAKREEMRGALKAYEAPEDAPPPPPEDIEESSD